LTQETPLVLVSALPPQNYHQAQVKGPSPNPCPITQEILPGVASYEIQASPESIQQEWPVIAVVTNTAVFSSVENRVQSDLDQNGNTQSFRACSSNDGVHLTMWSGRPLEGTLLWHGYYYEASNPGLGPPCTPHELSGPTAG
jgi:hypothetical protein